MALRRMAAPRRVVLHFHGNPRQRRAYWAIHHGSVTEAALPLSTRNQDGDRLIVKAENVAAFACCLRCFSQSA